MSKQLLFCVETSQKAKTDQIYIEETINNYYCLGNDIRVRYIYLNGKSNYNKPGIVKTIESQIRQYSSNGPTTVFYCIDTDRYDSDSQQHRELAEIVDYCKDKDYELIWFCRDIEDVYWGEQISKDEKKKKAAQFRSGRKIREISEEMFMRSKYSRHYSNIIAILDKYMKRK